MMRGGATEATLAIADAPIESPPTIAATWSAIFMHHDFSEPTRAKLRPGSLVLVNTTVFEGSFDTDEHRVVELPATDIAVDLGNIMTASMVMLGAYVAATDIVSLDSVHAAIAASLPAYRSQHVARNVGAVQAGFDAAPRAVVPAWDTVASDGLRA
jgi:2-oxoglutarate ferredoxin oxidoreductase subunit gamma